MKKKELLRRLHALRSQWLKVAADIERESPVGAVWLRTCELVLSMATDAPSESQATATRADRPPRCHVCGHVKNDAACQGAHS